MSKYYWIKLKTDFFDRDEIDFLLSQENGCEYIVLYQMLCLMVANTNGKLVKEMNEIIVPYDVKKIVRDTKYFTFDTVTIALELYKKLGLVYTDDNGCLFIDNYNDMVGCESEYASKKRIYREKRRLIEQNAEIEVDNKKTMSETISDKSIENRDKRLDIRDKSIDIEIDIDTDKEKASQASRRKETFSSIINNYTTNADLIDALNCYVEMRKKEKKFTPRALKINLTELDKLALDDLTKIDIINQTIGYGWKGFYPLKKEKQIDDGINNPYKSKGRAF